MPSRPPTTKHVAGSKTHPFHCLLPITENPNSSNQVITPALPIHIRTKDPSTAIRLLLSTFEIILAPEGFLEHPTIHQSITNLIPPATAGSVGESLPLRLVLPFPTIAIHKLNRRLHGLPGQGVHMTPLPLSKRGCHTPISLLLMTSRLQVPHNHSHSLLTRNNTSITTPQTNRWSGIARGIIDHTLGRTTHWSGMNLIHTPRLLPTSTPFKFHLPGRRDPRRSKRRPFLVARSDQSIITRD